MTLSLSAARLMAALALPCSLATVTAPALAQGPECQDLTPPEAIDPGWTDRPITPESLVRLRDIGPANDEISGRHLFALSPDGKQVAFQLRQADPLTNSYCFGMFVSDAHGPGHPRLIDAGGEFIMHMTAPFGRTNLPSGLPEVITPRWSPDGRWVAFLKRTAGKTRVWRAYADGSRSEIIAEHDAEIDDFRISANGRAILLIAKTGLAAALAGIAQEAKVGFHYGDRANSSVSPTPLPLSPLERRVIVMDLASGTKRPATGLEEALLLGPPEKSLPGALDVASAPDGQIAWTTASPGLRVRPADAIHAQAPDGTRTTCTDTTCTGVDGPFWWTSDGRHIRYFRREGWANSQTGIYEWTPGDASARKLYSTDAYLIDCQPDRNDLVCARETSLEPRHLVRLDPSTGKLQTLAQPNPEIIAARKGQVERIYNRNELGIEAFGDLVYPVGYQQGRSYSLIVVQYYSRGFLRAGIGEEYPIQALANKGYAVLSIHKGIWTGLRPEAKDWIEVDALNLKDFSERRSTLSTIEMIAMELVGRGIADPKRIGITGLSDGSSTVTFAAIHSKMFAAGIVGSCCLERLQQPLLGPMMESVYQRIGWPKPTDPAPDFWANISLAKNAGKIAFPLLMQLADSEYLPSLESYSALKGAGSPVDLFVFPDEFHIKWQPSHRVAAFQRTIDWFDFWLKDELPLDPRRRNEAERWRALKRGP